MKKTYILPITTVTTIRTSEHLLQASQNPNVSIGSGKTSTFDVKEASSSASYNVWDDDWSD